MHSFFLALEKSPSGFQYIKTILLVNYKFKYDEWCYPWFMFHLKHSDG